MKDEWHLQVTGDQPALPEWLPPVIDSAVGEGPDRWTYETFDLGSDEQPDLRFELRSPTRDAAITVTASASHAAGLFTESDPVNVSVRRTSAPAGGGLFAGRGGQVGKLEKRLVQLIEKQSKPVAPTATATAATGSASGAGAPTPPFGATGRARRRSRIRPAIVALVLVVAILAVVNFTGGFTSLLAALSPSSQSPTATPTAAVIKGKKPKKATACKPTFASDKTPARSAKGNKKTACAFAEEVRRAYIGRGELGKTVRLPNVFNPKSKKFAAIKCTGKSTVKCTNKANALVYLY